MTSKIYRRNILWLFCVGIGGAVESICRYLLGLIKIGSESIFPINTLIINVLGSFLIGIVALYSFKNSNMDSNLLLLLKIGICGGFTTFSTFAYETINLVQDGKVLMALIYIVLSVTLSLSALLLANILVK